MLRKCSLETLMKWIFMALALSMVTLTLGARFHQSYTVKRYAATRLGSQLKVAVETSGRPVGSDDILEQLGPYWRETAANEKPELTIPAGGKKLKLIIDSKALLVSSLEEERYLLLVGLLGLIAAVELAVLISYVLTRPLRRLAWGCKEIAEGAAVTIPQNALTPYEFQELTDSFNEMARQLDRWKEVQRQLSRMDRLAALGEMISSLSHEIRNPLASMRIQMDLLHSEVESILEDNAAHDSADAMEHIKILEGELDRLNGIVTQLLSFVRPRQPMMAPVLLEDLLPWCAAMLKAQAEKYNIAFATDRLDEGVTVMADNEMLQQLLMNLALNAIRSMSGTDDPNMKRLYITTGYSQNGGIAPRMGVLTVSDNGPGVPDDIQHRIFDPFFTTRKEGTGLGLSIVQRIVEGHGGSLSMLSSPEGTSFKVFLPLDLSTANPEKESTTEEVIQ